MHDDDSDREPILEAGTHPLPYVQQGMRLRHEHESSGVVWTVAYIYEDARDLTLIQLRHVDRAQVSRLLVVPSATCRAEYVLVRDFDPNSVPE